MKTFISHFHFSDSNGSQYAHSSDPREEYQQTYEALRAENTFLKQKIEQLQRKVVSFKKVRFRSSFLILVVIVTVLFFTIK